MRATLRETAGGFGSGAPQPAEIAWVADGNGPAAATVIAPVNARRGPAASTCIKSPDVLVSIRWDGTASVHTCAFEEPPLRGPRVR